MGSRTLCGIPLYVFLRRDPEFLAKIFAEVGMAAEAGAVGGLVDGQFVLLGRAESKTFKKLPQTDR